MNDINYVIPLWEIEAQKSSIGTNNKEAWKMEKIRNQFVDGCLLSVSLMILKTLHLSNHDDALSKTSTIPNGKDQNPNMIRNSIFRKYIRFLLQIKAEEVTKPNS